VGADEGEGGADVVIGEFGKVLADLFAGHARGEPTEDVTDGDAHAADAGLAVALGGLDGDDGSVVHGGVYRRG